MHYYAVLVDELSIAEKHPERIKSREMYEGLILSCLKVLVRDGQTDTNRP